MNIKYVVELNKQEREELQTLTRKGTIGARVLKRANLLLMADSGLADKDIVSLLNVSTATIGRTKRKFVEDGLAAALEEGNRSGCPRKFDAVSDALLTSIACSKPPAGCGRWSLQLIAQQFVLLLEEDSSVSIETIRRQLKNNDLKPWQKKMWCIGKMNAEYIARMEHVLDMYTRKHNPQEPVINFDEAMKQLVEDITPPTEAKPSQPPKVDYEYKRKAVANIFMFYDCHRGWRKAKATTHKKAIDFAHCMKDLVDIHYPDARKIHVIMDNFGTHEAGSLYKAFAPKEAKRILDKLRFHYTPKHASWLNKVEIEIGVMNRQCLNQRIPDWDTLHSELAAWETRRNEEKASINWKFDIEAAREKFTRAYEELMSWIK